MFKEMNKTEVIHVKETKIVGLNLKNSGLPMSFESLGKMWERYTQDVKDNTPNLSAQKTEYSISLNMVPDYIVGMEVTKIEDLTEPYFSYIIPEGDYVSTTFNAETHEALVGGSMIMNAMQETTAYAKKNKLNINSEFSLEVYYKGSKDYPCMSIMMPLV